MAPERKTKSKVDKSGDLGSQEMGPPQLSHLFQMTVLKCHLNTFYSEMTARHVETACGAEQVWEYR